ncbi:4-(cytidine 5'-diphospho)-2-C-methyl-D-erythritol kinase [Demequina rhizosphaerae]|uniref:4-(cytidine 5'-diphospho)-2-C-methyl-D-erythritol kinase n=1 Tax=Demequina rhizosphaerae TaxID=1638985 RepID=UPI00078558B4|nr:4-(cytidine 5'-diphospho)-2-C-methyl-D-erythritol kinase [Demequina rhizosphaerae]
MTRTVRAKAPAKVNLQLTVGPPRADGYHPLVTVFQALDLWEIVEATPRTDGEITLAVDVAAGSPIDASGVPLDRTNLAWKAAELLARTFGIADGVDLRIVKGVPVAGGMAGGSADAAAALVACAEAWDTGATRGELAQLAARLGADVPFSLHGHTAVGMGRGDELTPVMSHGEFHWVLATQASGLSTPEVFAEYDRRIDSREQAPSDLDIDPPLMRALMAGDAVALGQSLLNDLEGPALALMPRLEDVLDAAEAAEACGAIVSGSGPTVAALARSRQHALAIAAHLKASKTCDAVVTASGPASGTLLVQD